MADPRLVVLFGSTLAAVASILQIVGVITAHWVSDKWGDYGGLWNGCQRSGACYRIEDLNIELDWVQATRAFSVSAIIVMAATSACGVLSIVSSHQGFRDRSSRVAPALSAFGGICSLIGVVIFAVKVRDIDFLEEITYGYSFYLCVAAIILTFVSIPLFIVGRRRMIAI